MKKECRYSIVPVGQDFEYKGEVYTRFTHSRGKQIKDGKVYFKNFYKHEIVTWLNAYEE